MADLATRTGKEKHNHIADLLSRLQTDVAERNLSTAERKDIIAQLKIYGTVVDGADLIFEKQGIETLAHYAFAADTGSAKGDPITDGDKASSEEALRCIANALLLKPESRQVFVDLELTPITAEKLKSATILNQFILSRILFLLTYGTTVKFEELIEINSLAATIAKNLEDVAALPTVPKQVYAEMVLVETCKLIFNVLTRLPDQKPRFAQSISPLTTILLQFDKLLDAAQPPLSVILNALAILDVTSADRINALFPVKDPKVIVKRLIAILDHTMQTSRSSNTDTGLTILLNLLLSTNQVAPDEVKDYLRSTLLPNAQDRDLPLGKSGSLASRVLQLSTSSTDLNVRVSIQSLLFELCDDDPQTLINSVGFGYASGFLTNKGIAVSGLDGAAESTAEEAVNPITGQRLAAEAPIDTGPEMTDEEKEREAERLFVLFERLRATGVVNVENPVRRAQQKGRFEELPD